MALWLVKHVADPPTYVAARDDGAEVSVGLLGEDSLAYWRAVRMMLANVMRRFDDPEPKFAAHANEPEALAFAEMLNA